MVTVQQALSAVRIGEPMGITDGVLVFPLHTSQVLERDSITVAEAQSARTISVSECRSGARVSQLTVTVSSEIPVMIPEGMLLQGGRQNRIVNLSLLLPRGEHIIPVSCVEASRWSYRRPVPRPSLSRGNAPQNRLEPNPDRVGQSEHQEEEQPEQVEEFAACAFVAPPTIRAAKLRAMANQNQSHVQSTVWNSVDEKINRERTPSITRDLNAVFGRERVEDIRRKILGINPLPDQIGILVAIGDVYYALEYFDCPETWAAVHHRVLGSYLSDASLAPGHTFERVPTAEEMQHVFIGMTEPGPNPTAPPANSSIYKTSPAPAGLGTHTLIRAQRMWLDVAPTANSTGTTIRFAMRTLSGLAFHANDRMRHVALFVGRHRGRQRSDQHQM